MWTVGSGCPFGLSLSATRSLNICHPLCNSSPNGSYSPPISNICGELTMRFLICLGIILLLFLSIIGPINTFLYIPCDETAANPKITHTFGRGHTDHLEWHPSADLILVSTIRGAWLYDGHLGDIAHIEDARLATFSPNGHLIAGVDSKQRITLWNTFTGQQIDCLTEHAATVTALTWHPDGKLIVSADRDGRVLVWNAAHREIVREWHLDQPIVKVHWNPSGTTLAVLGFNSAVYVYNFQQNMLLLKEGPTQCCTLDDLNTVENVDIVWKDDDQLLRIVIDDFNRAHNTNLQNGQPTLVPPNMDYDTFLQVDAVSPDRHWTASSGWAGQATISLSPTNDPWSDRFELLGHRWGTTHLAWSHSNQHLVSSGFYGEIIVWDVFNVNQIAINTEHAQSTPRLPSRGVHLGNPNVAGLPEWSPNSDEIAIPSPAKGIELWDLSTNSVSATIPITGQQVENIIWNPEYDLIATVPDNWFRTIDDHARIWDINGQLIDSISDGRAVNWHPNGEFLGVGIGSKVYLWNVETRQLQNPVDILSITDTHAQSELYGIQWSPDGDIIVLHYIWGDSYVTSSFWFPSYEDVCGSFDGCGYGYALSTGPYHNTSDVWSLGSDRRLLASWDNGFYEDHATYVVSLSILYSNSELSFATPVLVGHTGLIQNVIWSPTANHLISISTDGTARLWDVQTGNTLHIFPNVTQAYWSPDGTVIALYDSAVHEWRIVETISAETITTIHLTTFSIGHIVWSPDGRKLAHVLDGVTTIWEPFR